MNVVICWENPVGAEMLRGELSRRGCSVVVAVLPEDVEGAIGYHHPDVLVSSTAMTESFAEARRAMRGRVRLIALAANNEIRHNRHVFAFCSPSLDNIGLIAATVFQ